MNLTIKTNFGEFNFDMDAQSAQEIVNQAFQKAAGRKPTKETPGVQVAEGIDKGMYAPSEDVRKKVADG